MPTSMQGDAYKVLTQALVSARKEAGLTQTELGKRLSKGQKYVSVIETGIRRIDLIEFVAFARALGIGPEALLSALLSELPAKLEI